MGAYHMQKQSRIPNYRYNASVFRSIGAFSIPKQSNSPIVYTLSK